MNLRKLAGFGLVMALSISLIGSAFAAPVCGVYADGSDCAIVARVVSDCSCGGVCIVREEWTGGRDYVLQYDRCPENRDYRCRLYLYEYLITYTCNRCGASLKNSKLDYREVTEHLH